MVPSALQIQEVFQKHKTAYLQARTFVNQNKKIIPKSLYEELDNNLKESFDIINRFEEKSRHAYTSIPELSSILKESSDSLTRVQENLDFLNTELVRTLEANKETLTALAEALNNLEPVTV